MRLGAWLGNYSYEKSEGDFLHETTVDQWFSESQFESYRMLGYHSLVNIAQDPQLEGRTVQFNSLEEFLNHVRTYLAGP